MDLNIVIRTMLLRKGKGHLQVGAGIVYDSNPEKEYNETLHKARALTQALCEAGL
jgi:para-aminobenzoate synthetase component 1